MQRDLPKALMFTATYLGIKGTRARQEVLAQAHSLATKFIVDARAAAVRVGEEETQKAIATA